MLKKILEKSFDKKNFEKINYKRKIFITKIYSNIDKCHTIFALLRQNRAIQNRQCRALALNASNVAI